MLCSNRQSAAPVVRSSRGGSRCSSKGSRGRLGAQQCCATVQQPALLYDFHDQLVPYDQAWAWQKQRVAELCCAATADRRDTVFLVQHPPVYTLGAGSSESHVKFDLQQPPHPLYRTERGGEVTYHGPGQLVMYPVLDLAHHSQDLHWYLRSLEEVVLRALADTSGLQGERIEGLTGVWVDGHKLAAIGVRARKWVTYHGLALNVSTVLHPFQQITPCGISDRPVGSVKQALARAAAAAAGQGHQQHDLGLLLQRAVPADGAGSGSSGGLHSNSSNSSNSSSSSSSSDYGGGGGSLTGRGNAGSPQQQQGSSRLQEDLYAVSSDPLIVEYRYALLEALEAVFGLQLQPASQQQVQRLLELSSGSSSSSGGNGGNGGGSSGSGGAVLTSKDAVAVS